MCGFANAQTPSNSNLLSYSNDKSISAEDSGFHYFNEIHSRAVREFMRDYEGVYNVKWYKYKKGYVAAFDRDSITTKLHYNKRGDFEVQLRYFNENKLPSEIQDLVKSRYIDYDIFQVCEVSGFGKTFYQIKIRNENYCKVINVINGEIKVMVKYTDTALR